MIVVDTSVWIAYLRRGDPEILVPFNRLLDDDRVVLPAIVRLELTTGTGPKYVARLNSLLDGVHGLLPEVADWRHAQALALAGAMRGERFGAADLLIAAAAARGGMPIWSHDSDFERMEKLGFCQVWRPPK